jgi:hypothetical protein
MRELHGDDALGCKEDFHALNKAVEIWYLSKYIVAY